jgi:spoIIIJ-associated protein
VTTDFPQFETTDEADTDDIESDLDIDALSDKGQHAVEVLTGLLERMGLDGEIVGIEEGERIEVELAGPDAGRVIGKKGQTLDALQFLVNKVVNRFPENRRHIVLDVEGYKERRDDSLIAMAHRLAEKADRSGKVISISPMPARERRVIHLALADHSSVATRSDGHGTERRVRIIPDRRRSR